MSTTDIALQVAPVVTLLAAMIAWTHRRWVLCALLTAAAALLVGALLVDVRLAGVAAGLLIATVIVVVVRHGRTAATVTRWGTRSRRTSGVATTLDVIRVASFAAMRRKATVVRPSLAGLTRWQRAWTRTTAVAVRLCRVGLLGVWSSIEDVTLIFGGPRKGKTGWLAGPIVDAPGAAVVTSTRTDLHRLTSGLRARTGPTYVFNPAGVGDLENTIGFNPLTGCTDPVAADERAGDLLAAGSRGDDGERAFWTGQARRVLAALVHAAALGGLSMRTVLEWVSDPAAAQREVTSLLRRSPEPAFVEAVTQFLEMSASNPRTATSITSTIMPALGWLTSPAATAAAECGAPFDVAELLRERGTVYLLGGEETQSAPLVCALTGHIARQARRQAERQPGGRLDPPLTLALDEAALISPVPLDSWTADMGGRGVCIIAAFQSRSQLVARWGQTGAGVILNNAGAVMVFGGTKDPDDLAHWAQLAGERDEPVNTTDKRGRVTSQSSRKVAVIAASRLANLPRGQVVVFSAMPPVVGRVRMAWTRRDVRAQQRAAHQATRGTVGSDEYTSSPARDEAAPTSPGGGAPATSPASPGEPGWTGDRAPAWVTDREGTTQKASHDGR